VLLGVTVGTLLVVAPAILYRTAQLRSGGGKVAQLLGGKLVEPATADPKERLLRNVVEEMAIASGVPVPEVWVLDDEQALNAFAAGWSPADAAVAVTRGCLEQLDRDELQGVIAHEFSHVFHGDMRLNIRLIAVVFGIVCITTIGRILLRATGRGVSSGGRGKGGAAGLALFGLCLILIGALGVLFARMIQAAVSRRREYLADASAVQYTRNAHGIGQALAKIAGIGGRLQNAHAEEASHLLFADGLVRFFGGAFTTHPPILERIERILPGFRRRIERGEALVAAVAATPAPVTAMAGLVGGPAAAPPRAVPVPELLATVGAPQARHVAAARDLLRDLPLDLLAAARDAARAPAVLVALLLDADGPRRQAQLESIRRRDLALAHDANGLFASIASCSPGVRLPLLELAIPALRSLPPAARERVRADARALAVADGKLSPFELALCKTLERHVRLANEPPRRPPGRPAALATHQHDSAVVVSVLARAGAHDEDAAERAFDQGMLGLAIEPAMKLLPAGQCTIEALERAVDALAAVSPLGKRNLLAACASAAGADNTLLPDEADLLRALAESWDCPIPLVATPAGALHDAVTG
jgi:Zn-dependent protease with chaperone function